MHHILSSVCSIDYEQTDINWNYEILFDVITGHVPIIYISHLFVLYFLFYYMLVDMHFFHGLA